MRWLAVFVLALSLVAAGCGGGNDEAATDTTTTTETTTTDTTTTDESATDETETTDTSGSGSLGDVSGDCLAAVTAFVALGQAVGGSGGGNTEDVLNAQKAFDDYIAKAPDEIKNDLQVIATAYGKYIKAVSDLGLAPGETPSTDQLAQLSGASAELTTPEVQAASEHWNAWATQECPSG